MILSKIFKTTLLSSTVLASALIAQEDPTDAVIPRPVHSQALEGEFSLDRYTFVTANSKLSDVAEIFSKKLNKHTGLVLSVSEAMNKFKKIQFELGDIATKSKEGYKITVRENEVTIKAPSKAGLFYGGQTLIQMIDEKADALVIPCSDVKDEPRFPWRGLMLDEARHFFGKNAVKELLDNMALRKMNRFHWHLTDDEGWRVEVKGYPKLTEIGAWRGEGTTMPAVRWRKKEEGKGPRYGGFYTQEDLKEIVAYAAERHIEIIPEFDMPGHVTALKESYPELCVTPDPKLLEEVRKNDKSIKSWEASGDSPRAYRGNTMDVVNPKTYEFCEALFDQMTAIFPSKYWHIGGDEVRTLFWKATPSHVALMKEKGFKDYYELQNMFLKRMSEMLRERGRIMMGWNEILHGGDLPKDTIVMGWLGDGPGIHAAKLGYPTVMANSSYNYFDMLYPGKGERKAHSWAGPIDSKRAYEWDPVFPKQLKPEQQVHVNGVHACVWAEHVNEPSDMSYKFWPRAASVAEVGWTPQELRNWDSYAERFGKHAKFFDNMKTVYRVRPPKVTLSKGAITIEAGIPGYDVHYTTDGSEPTRSNSKLYQGEKLDASLAGKVKAVTFRPNRLKSITIDETYRPFFAKWDMPNKHQKPRDFQAEITSSIDKAGQWSVYFTPGRHLYPSTVKSIEIKQNGQVISKLDKAFDVDRKEMKFDFELKDFDKSAKYEIKVNMVSIHRSHGKTTGFISVDRK